MEKRLVKIGEAAALLGVNVETLRSKSLCSGLLSCIATIEYHNDSGFTGPSGSWQPLNLTRQCGTSKSWR
jgi:hypothetical protein